MLKRLVDLVLAAFGLIVLSPLLLALAAWIRLDSPGPVFYRQDRVGRRGVLFRIHKLRSMRDAPATGGVHVTVGDDPRITRAGRFIRRHRLDELPQLIDVLAGSMSLVGPRPEVPRYVAHYPAELRDKVLSVRPGITDRASLEFLDEAELLAHADDPERAYIETVLPIKLGLAARYVDEASISADLRIIAATLATLVIGRARARPKHAP